MRTTAVFLMPSNGQTAAHFEVGDQLFGRFLITKTLGTGSIGSVYACENKLSPGQTIALKILSPQCANDERLISAFRTEIQASYRIKHPNVVRCYEFFRDENIMGISMEYVDGMCLGSIFENNHTFTLTETLDIVQQLCQGLAAIHDAAIIHQDLKPHNILVNKRGGVKIADFTASHVCSRRGDPNSTTIFGTIDFVSPETIMHGCVDRRSDIFALGTIMYMLVTGVMPYAHQDLAVEVQNKIKGRRIAPHKINTACPILLSKIIQKALHPNPDNRFQHPKEILDCLTHGMPREDNGIVKRLLSLAGIGS